MILILTLLAFVPTVNAAEIDLTKHISIEIQSNDEFGVLCRKMRFPCAEIRLANENLYESPKDSVVFDDQSIRAILDDIQQRHAGYQWRITDGVLRFAPDETHQLAKSSVLNQSVRRFKKYGVTLRAAIADLARQVHIKIEGGSTVSAQSISDYELEVSSEKQTINLDVRDSSVEKIMNSAVATHGHGMWRFQYGDEKGRKDRVLTLCY